MSNCCTQQIEFSLTADDLSFIQESFPQGLVAFDTETTGLSPLTDEIIEIAAVKIYRGQISHFSALIKPTVLVREEIIAIHGISNEMLTEAPAVSEVLPQFFAFVGTSALVAHNAKFDLGFLIFQCSKLKYSLPELDCYCSCHLSRSVFSSLTSHKLSSLAKHFKIDLENHHRALDDSMAALHIFLLAMKADKNFKRLGFQANLRDYNKNIDFVLPENLKLLEQYSGLNQELEILYSGGSQKGKFRPIIPLSLLPMPAGNILYAHCLLSDQYKSFALSKIKEVRKVK
jgi:DNA polymerase III subunit epsilon